MSRKQLTSKQHTFLQFLADHVRRQKVWPTYREIVEEFGYRSPNSVTQNLQALAKKGYLTRDQNGYRLLGQRAGLNPGGFPVQGVLEDEEFKVSLSIDEITLKDLFPGLDRTFAVATNGHLVRGLDDIAGGYLLLQEGSIGDGHVSTVICEGTVALCRVYHESDGLCLQYLDGDEEHVRSDQVKLLGRYAGHINDRGLFRAPSAVYNGHALNGETVTTT
ncbi:MAG: repressor LexA [Bacteroidota bacterium]